MHVSYFETARVKLEYSNNNNNRTWKLGHLIYTTTQNHRKLATCLQRCEFMYVYKNKSLSYVATLFNTAI